MKMNFQKAASSEQLEARSPHPGLQPSTFCLPPSRQGGMALIITLILLSITLVMAIAFLAVSRRERASVTTNTELTIARLATDAARSAAEAQIIANIRSSTNAGLYNNTLLVSTNYINSFGFVPGSANPTNVNYDYRSDSAAFTADDRNQNIANLLFLPRAPVSISDPVTGSNDFRFYLDVNRNGQFEGTGDGVPYVENDGSTNGFASAVGDPQWIGVLAKPGEPHGPNNPFLARYCYFALPEGNSLDINYMHNEAFNQTVQAFPNQSGINESFLRNQGVGSWEINLAAFLADLNTNAWNNPLTQPYQYFEPFSPNRGFAFEDALGILSWRYGYNYNSLATGFNSFSGPVTGNYPFNLDGYSDSPLQTTLNTNASIFSDNLNSSWAGADNFNHFYSPSDLFDPAKSSGGLTGGFTNRLLGANSGVSTYDRYTFYRLLDQLGTSSSADGGKMNLNYRNITNGMVIDGMETNLYPWTAMDFFTNAADRMLRFYTTEWFRSGPSNYLATYYGLNVGTNNFNYVNGLGTLVTYDPTGFGLTNIPFYGMTNQLPSFGINDIPVWVNGRFVYSSSVNRVLQLAANLFEATTNEFYPIVYRPIFEYNNLTNVFITDYTNLFSIRFGFNTVDNLGDPQLNPPFHVAELPSFPDFTPITSNGLVNVYGVPWIIGARKGFPNFNKLGLENVIQVTRKMQVRRKGPPVSGVPSELVITNQMYGFSINNNIGVECWNSYAGTYPNTVQIMVRDSVSLLLTNDNGSSPVFATYALNTNVTLTSWPGYAAGNAASFIPITRSFAFLPDDAYYFGSSPPGLHGFYLNAFNSGWESNNPSFNLPQLGLLTTNQFQLAMLDVSNGIPHVIDYVQFSGPSSSRNINSVLQTNSTELSYANMWSTNLNSGGVPYGVWNQWDTSVGTHGINGLYWKNPVTGANTSSDAKNEIIGFCMFLGISSPFGPATISDPALASYYTNRDTVQLPYTPTALIVDYTGWQANDPLVHYLASDLANNIADNGGNLLQGINKLNDGIKTAPTPNYSQKNDRYQPWGVSAPNEFQSAVYNFTDPYNLIYKDPLVTKSDNWDFPTNKLPSVGWIGRVHRGTPWQTVYLKARNVLRDNNNNTYPNRGLNTWAEWTGDFNAFDAANSAPVADRMLFDLFTTRLNENAAHGTLSVNQTHLASWSAVLGGVVVLSNNLALANGFSSPTTTSLIINPAGVDREASPLWQMVTNINALRSSYPQGAFKHVGDVLSAIKLTEQSPFINTNSSSGRSVSSQLKYGISDEVYEWLPQQVLGLLRVNTEPRYTIYTYGQTLKPTLNGTVLNGSFFGLVTNYQVVAESAARATVTVQPVVTNTLSGPLTNYLMKVENYTVLPPE